MPFMMLIVSCQQPPIANHDLHAAHDHREASLSRDVQNLLEPVNKKVVGDMPVVYAERGDKLFEKQIQGRITYDSRGKTNLSSRVAGRIERLTIKYNFQAVQKGDLIMEIYSPELLVAQRELLFLDQEPGLTDLKQSAIQKLKYLGMTSSQINQVLQSRKPLYRLGVYSPVSGFVVDQTVGLANQNTDLIRNQSPVMVREGQYIDVGERVFSIYDGSRVVAEYAIRANDKQAIYEGQKIVYSPQAKPQQLDVARIDMILPMFREGENFALLRSYLSKKDLLIGELVEATVPYYVEKGQWLPQSAVLDLGGRSVVFVLEDKVFVPREIEKGIQESGLVQVMNDLGGIPVARHASYMVDSESFIVAK